MVELDFLIQKVGLDLCGDKKVYPKMYSVSSSSRIKKIRKKNKKKISTRTFSSFYGYFKVE